MSRRYYNHTGLPSKNYLISLFQSTDGKNNGIDADTLGGKHASSYVTRDEFWNETSRVIVEDSKVWSRPVINNPAHNATNAGNQISIAENAENNAFDPGYLYKEFAIFKDPLCSNLYKRIVTKDTRCFPDLEPNTTYYVVCRYRLGELVGNWSYVVKFTTGNSIEYIGRPNMRLWGNHDKITNTIRLEAITPYYSRNGSSHTSTTYEIYNSEGKKVYDIPGDTVNKEGIIIRDIDLAPGEYVISITYNATNSLRSDPQFIEFRVAGCIGQYEYLSLTEVSLPRFIAMDRDNRLWLSPIMRGISTWSYSVITMYDYGNDRVEYIKTSRRYSDLNDENYIGMYVLNNGKIVLLYTRLTTMIGGTTANALHYDTVDPSTGHSQLYTFGQILNVTATNSVSTQLNNGNIVIVQSNGNTTDITVHVVDTENTTVNEVTASVDTDISGTHCALVALSDDRLALVVGDHDVTHNVEILISNSSYTTFSRVTNSVHSPRMKITGLCSVIDDNDNIIISGGTNVDGDTLSSNLVYDVDNNSWSSIHPLPNPDTDIKAVLTRDYKLAYINSYSLYLYGKTITLLSI